MSLIMPLIEPRPATQKDVADLETAVGARLTEQFGRPEAMRRIVQKLPGQWGEAGCGVIYRFQLIEGAVLIDLVRKQPGMADYSMAASITPGGANDEIHAVIERTTEPGEAQTPLVFTYVGTGGGERLTWLNRSQNDVGGLELDRCK